MDSEVAGDYLALLKALINVVDQAMADEGVDAGVRDRVVSRIYATPAPDVVTVPPRDWPPMNAGGL